MLDAINSSIWNNSVYSRTKKKTMKRSQLRELIKEVMAKGFEPDEEGNLVPHNDDFTSTKLSDILLKVAKRRPEEEEKYQGDPQRGNDILDRGNPNIPLDEGEGKMYSKNDAISYIENNRGAKYYRIATGRGTVQKLTDAAKAMEAVQDSPITQFELDTHGDTIQFSAPL